MRVIKLEQGNIARDIPFLGIEQQINVSIKFCSNLTIYIKETK